MCHCRCQELSSDLEWCPRNFLHRGKLRLLAPGQQPVEVYDALPADLRHVLAGLVPANSGSEGLLSALVAGEVGHLVDGLILARLRQPLKTGPVKTASTSDLLP